VIVVSGYYGFGNLGDEAILDALCSDLEALGYGRKEIYVLSGNPKETMLTHGVQAFSRYNLLDIWRKLGLADCLISGGGSLFQDVTSRRTIPYYLSLIEMALLRKVPVIIYAQGVGPIQSRMYQAWVKRAFRSSMVCSVRDEESARFLHNLGVSPDKLRVTADPVFQIRSERNLTSKSNKIMLNLRPYDEWNNQLNHWIDFIKMCFDEKMNVEFIPLGPGDEVMGKILRLECPNLVVHPTLTLFNYGEVFADAHLCISMRLHGIIFSALHQVLTIGLNYDPKVEAISKQLSIPLWDLDSLLGIEEFAWRVLKRRDYYEKELSQAVKNLSSISATNRSMLAQALKG